MDVMLTVFFAICIFIFTFVLLLRGNQRHKPPGPKRYPIIGSLFSIDIKCLHISLTKIAEIYGDIFQINLFGQSIIVLNSPNLIRETFLQEPNATISSNRVEGSLTKEIYHGLVDIVFSQYNRDWVKRRKLGYKVIKAYGEGMKNIESNMKKQLQVTIKDMEKTGGNPFDPETFIDAFLTQLIAILLSGRRHDMDSNFIKAIVNHESTLNQILAPDVSYIIDWLPFMRYVPGPVSRKYHNFKKYQKEFDEAMKQENEVAVSNGMIHELYSEMNKLANKGTGDWLTENSVNTILSNLVGGAILTSKGTIWSGISILLHRQDIQEKLQEEVDRVVGPDRQPSLSDKEYMPYTDAFVLEVLRLISHLPLLLPHCAASRTKIAGYDIEQGSTIIANIWKIHHDSSIYDGPYEFDPGRFLDHDGSLLPADHPLRQSLLTFGLGKRSCIGEAFAKNRLFLFFSTMMQSFTFLADESERFSKFDPRDMEVLIVNMPKRFKCRAVERKMKSQTN